MSFCGCHWGLTKHLCFWHNLSNVPEDTINVVKSISGSEILPRPSPSPKVKLIGVVPAAYSISHSCFQRYAVDVSSSVSFCPNFWHHWQYSGAGSNGHSTKVSGGSWGRNAGAANNFLFYTHLVFIPPLCCEWVLATFMQLQRFNNYLYLKIGYLCRNFSVFFFFFKGWDPRACFKHQISQKDRKFASKPPSEETARK